jgi:hypothetical protein
VNSIKTPIAEGIEVTEFVEETVYVMPAGVILHGNADLVSERGDVRPDDSSFTLPIYPSPADLGTIVRKP